MKLGYMARDQYGETLHLTDIKRHPRGQLLAKVGRKHCQKMHYDSVTTGKPVHSGYVVAGHWYTIYEVHGWQGGVL